MSYLFSDRNFKKVYFNNDAKTKGIYPIFIYSEIAQNVDIFR